MKKTFFVLGIVGALSIFNAYAGDQQSITVTYTCPDGCNITNNTELTSFGCLFAAGDDCGNPIANISEEIEEVEDVVIEDTPIVNAITKAQTKENKPVSARAGKIGKKLSAPKPTPMTTKPTKPQSDNAQSGFVYIECPKACHAECYHIGNNSSCRCVTEHGRLCEERIETGENKPVPFEK